MKKIIFLLLLSLVIFVNAQFSLIIDHNTYGRLEPVANYNGYLLCVSKNSTNTVTGLYKINISNNQITPITIDNTIGVQNLDQIAYQQDFYGNNIYSAIYGTIVKIDLNNNTLTATDVSSNDFITIFNDKMYYNQTHYKDLLTNTNYLITQAPDYVVFGNSNSKMINGNCYFIKGNQIGPINYFNKLEKYYSDGVVSTIFEATPQNENQIIGINFQGKPLFANNKLFYKLLTNNFTISKLLVTDINSNTTNQIIFDASMLNSNLHLILNDGIIFQDPPNFYKTDGGTLNSISNYTSSSNESICGFFGAPNLNNTFSIGHDCHLKIGNTTYFLTLSYGTNNSYIHKIYKTNSINDTPTLINTWNGLTYNSDISNAIELNGQLYFYVQTENKIYRYDGTQLYNNDINVNSVTSGNMFTRVDGLYLVGNNLVAETDQGIMKLSTSTLTTQENQKPTLKLYPNPSKSTLNFSEELSEIKVIDMSGKQVSATPSKTKTINVENLPKGNYIITAKNKNGKTISEKFIKE